MHAFLGASHRFPAAVGGPGGGRVFDNIARGLAALKVRVSYRPGRGHALAAPPGVRFVDEPPADADIWHLRSDDPGLSDALEQERTLVATCHTDIAFWGQDREIATPNWIFVSEALAHTYGSQRFVLNGIDPDEFIFSADKGEYVLWMGVLRLALEKGLDTALEAAHAAGRELVVAGGSSDPQVVRRIQQMCARTGARWVGEAYGTRRASLLAGARALLFPTRMNEAFGQVLAEAMMSGTPVISSDQGACPDLVTPNVGFVCTELGDYVRAVEQADRISPVACREKALREFHYLRMAEDYVREYELELGR